MTMKNTKKQIGDWVHLYGKQFYQIKDDPKIFFSNRMATEEEIKEFKQSTKL